MGVIASIKECSKKQYKCLEEAHLFSIKDEHLKAINSTKLLCLVDGIEEFLSFILHLVPCILVWD
jgi:hypothetical protein